MGVGEVVASPMALSVEHQNFRELLQVCVPSMVEFQDLHCTFQFQVKEASRKLEEAPKVAQELQKVLDSLELVASWTELAGSLNELEVLLVKA